MAQSAAPRRGYWTIADVEQRARGTVFVGEGARFSLGPRRNPLFDREWNAFAAGLAHQWAQCTSPVGVREVEFVRLLAQGLRGIVDAEWPRTSLNGHSVSHMFGDLMALCWPCLSWPRLYNLVESLAIEFCFDAGEVAVLLRITQELQANSALWKRYVRSAHPFYRGIQDPDPGVREDLN